MSFWPYLISGIFLAVMQWDRTDCLSAEETKQVKSQVGISNGYWEAKVEQNGGREGYKEGWTWNRWNARLGTIKGYMTELSVFIVLGSWEQERSQESSNLVIGRRIGSFCTNDKSVKIKGNKIICTFDIVLPILSFLCHVSTMHLFCPNSSQENP